MAASFRIPPFDRRKLARVENPLRLAVIAHAHFDDVRLPFPPVWMQRAGLAMGAPIGRLMGFTPTYEPAAGTPLTA